MLNANAFANASAVIMAAFFIICRVLASVMPNFVFRVGQSWFHTVSLGSGPMSSSYTLGTLALGLVSAVALTWIASFMLITLYNKLAKE